MSGDNFPGVFMLSTYRKAAVAVISTKLEIMRL